MQTIDTPSIETINPVEQDKQQKLTTKIKQEYATVFARCYGKPNSATLRAKIRRNLLAIMMYHTDFALDIKSDSNGKITDIKFERRWK